jgi:glycosyltransferase involved in cell wall biosynthesis
VKVVIIGGIFGRPPEYAADISKTPEVNLLEGLSDRGIDVRGVPHRWLPKHSKADIVHVHHLAKGTVAYTMTQPLLAKRMVFTRHGLYGELSPARQRVLQATFRRADAVIALSEYEAGILRPQVKGRLEVIPNGIRGCIISSRLASPYQHPGRLRLLYVGQLIPLKRLDVLLRALATVRQTIDVELRLVYHNDALEAGLHHLADELDMAERVTFVGRRGPREVFAEYARAHALVLPSAVEALPSVVTESLLSARPVVASAVGGIPEQVGDAGILVPANDVAALGAALQTLAMNYGTYLEAATARSKRVAEEYSVNRMVDRHVALYESLLRSRDRHRSGLDQP